MFGALNITKARTESFLKLWYAIILDIVSGSDLLLYKHFNKDVQHAYTQLRVPRNARFVRYLNGALFSWIKRQTAQDYPK